MGAGQGAFLSGTLCVILVGPSFAGAWPDLAVVRDGLAREGAEAIVVIENRGEAPSPETLLEISDRVMLTGPTGTSTPYPHLPNQTGVSVFQEPAEGGGIALTLAVGRERDSPPPFGVLNLLRGDAIRPVRPVPGVIVEDDAVRWQASEGESDLRIPLHIPARGEAPIVLLSPGPDPGAVAGLVPVRTFESTHPASSRKLVLDCLERPRARVRRVPVPPIPAGEHVRLAVPFEKGAPDEFFVRVDPDARVAEAREGNNHAAWHADRDGWTLAVLHVHSSFSEGIGSVDWQVHQAAASGYDLIWWSEHDWRVSCVNHVDQVGFEAGERVGVHFEKSDPALGGAVAGGERVGGERALHLAAPRGVGGSVRAVLEARRLMRYTLASDLRISFHVLARNLSDEDRLSVIAELSVHPEERRTLTYELRREGAPRSAAGRTGTRAEPVLERSVATGSWIRVELALTADADSLWANGRDDNLMTLVLELSSPSGGAEVWVDDIVVSPEICGNELRKVQAEWMKEYPNVRHLFAEEVSSATPHLNEYGRRRDLDYEEVWGGHSVERTVRRTHDAGGIVAWCHPFGTNFRRRDGRYSVPAYRDSLIDARFGGTDILEVGFRKKANRRLKEYLEYWDAAGRRGVAITGIGVNDSHGLDWGSWEDNFATWIAAPAGDERALLKALRAGHVFFGDPLLFRGRLRIRVGSARGGDVVGGSAPREVVVSVDAAPAGSLLRVVVDGETRSEWNVTGSSEQIVRLGAGEVRLVRAELRGPREEPLAFTNPIYFDPSGRTRRAGP